LLYKDWRKLPLHITVMFSLLAQILINRRSPAFADRRGEVAFAKQICGLLQ
jgi:hypothetical protein